MALGNGLRPQSWAKFLDRFGKDIKVAEFYAASEGPVGTINLDNHFGSIGSLSPFLKVRQNARLVLPEAKAESKSLPSLDQINFLKLPCWVVLRPFIFMLTLEASLTCLENCNSLCCLYPSSSQGCGVGVSLDLLLTELESLKFCNTVLRRSWLKCPSDYRYFKIEANFVKCY